MKRFFVAVVCMLFLSRSSSAQSLLKYVDPFIGSGEHGHVFVGASVPFGAVQVGPNNIYKGWDWCSGYNYGDSMMIGFSQTHLSGTGIGDLADVLIMPYTGAVKLDKGKEGAVGSGYASLYNHQNEKARAGYYSVKLLDYNIDVELTATERVGFHKYKFPANKEAHVIIDLKEGINDKGTDTYIKLVDAYTLEGHRFSSGWAKDQRLYFAIKSSVPITAFKVFENDSLFEGKEGQGKMIKGLISFANDGPAKMDLKVGISPVSSANALANINAEIPHWDFQKVVKQAEAKWEKELSVFSIQGKSEADKRVFYTALFHTMINPSLFNDHNKDYRGADKNVYPKASFANYSVFSLWDTYRATHPLYTITQQQRLADMINSMLAIYKQSGKLPIWHLMGNETGTMVGISSLQVIAEAYLKGIKGFDVNAAYEAVKATAMTEGLGLNFVKNAQYIPADKMGSSVARGLEYAISDLSIALMAKQLGKTEDYNYFLKRADSYKLYFDDTTQFFRGKKADGTWNANFSATASRSREYTEGNAWQYLWLAPQDVEGLISLLGGEKNFASRLDTFFTLHMNEDTKQLVDLTGLIGQYAHGNEPGHHIPYLYAFAGQQWKTAEKVRYIMKEFYHDKPAGIIGNEDCGQMSAWYVFSALGFYPVFPASGQYVIGSPVFDKATINLPGGKKFTVEAVGNSASNIYIQRIELNGKPYKKTYLLHSDIMKGGTVKFFMSNLPVKNAYTPSTKTLDKKVMFGYQGWHATPNDGAGNNVWRHWFGRNTPDSAMAVFDVWPDMTEYPEAATEATNMNYADGSKAKLYSAYKYEAVDVHFKWLADHDLDGVFEQRFLSDIRSAGGRKHFNQVVKNVQAASEKYKRVYCIMYDISGAGPLWKETLMNDWKFLVDSFNVTQGSSYLHHKNRPLVAIWGFGFSHNQFATFAQVDSLLKWFHGGAEKKYQATIMGGINDDWLKHSSDWKAVYNQLDIISPWAVGRYRDDAGADQFKARAVVPDKAYCDQQKIDYMPVIFPGFSWYNLRRGRSPFNQIPRRGGDFFWRQSYNVIDAGVNMVYIAMYDEVDEGTAMYKITTRPSGTPVNGKFISLEQDGYTLPADWYLRLAAAVSEIVRGKVGNSEGIPEGLLRERKKLIPPQH